MFKISLIICSSFLTVCVNAQIKWTNADAEYNPLPRGFHVYKTTDSLNGQPFLAYYAIADLQHKGLEFTVDTTYKRRMTPTQFYEKNAQPLLVVNTTFFSFATHQNLNVVIRNGELVGYNIHSLPMKGKDSLQYRHPFGSALGLSKNRKADIAWLLTDSSKPFAYATQLPQPAGKDSVAFPAFQVMKKQVPFKKWRKRTAVGGGPVLVQNSRPKVTNNEELKFAGKAIDDKHPRTLMGYTGDNKLIIMVIQGRSPGQAEGATLAEEAKLMAGLGCVEALNLDGGGSSCMLINGKETIWPSDKGQQRAIPAVFIIKSKAR